MPEQAPPPPPARAGLSLYANLLNPGASSDQASISRAPVVSQEALHALKEHDPASTARRPIDAALRFQPLHQIRRPQHKTQKPKAFPKATVPSVVTNSATSLTTAEATTSGTSTPATAPLAPANPQKPTLADWQATQEEDEWVYGTGEKRPRGGKRKKKGGRRGDDAPAETDWNEIYDPSRPTNVDEYLRSDERVREVQEWKALLYRHRRQGERQRSRSWSSDDEDMDSRSGLQNQHPPTGSYNFAPPPMSPPRVPVPGDGTGDDAYLRRLALTQGTTTTPVAPPPPPPPPIDEDPLPPSDPVADSSTISRGPVRYTPSSEVPGQQNTERDTDVMDEDSPQAENADEGLRSNRPGQKGFAARLMAKYGWSKGQGLGAEASGILQPLKVQVEKRKKNENGGYDQPGGRGKIVAPKQAAKAHNASSASSSAATGSKFGKTSNVVVLRSMLEGMEDLQSEMENGLGQEIGEECGDKYGRVDRLYIDIEGKRVYIKFTDGVSALRAVNALDGRVFAGNTIVPQFYDLDKFEQRVYE